MSNDKLFYDYEDLMNILGCSKTMSYRLINQLNKELLGKGYITFRGKISCQYLNDRIGLNTVEK